MDWLKDLFVEHSALQAVVVISLISTIGIGLGKIRFFGISLGTAFIFSWESSPGTSASRSTPRC